MGGHILDIKNYERGSSVQKKEKRNLDGCVCPKRTGKSFFGMVDVMVGSVIILALAVVLLFVRQPYIMLFLFLLLWVCWLVLFSVRFIQGHSAVCAARWGVIVLLGSIGGFGFLNL
jgi:hypothetical protein